MMRGAIVIVLCFISVGVYAQDRLYDRSGQTIQAKVLEIGQTDILFKKQEQPDGPTYRRPLSDFDSIRFADGSRQLIPHTAVARAVPAASLVLLPSDYAKNTIFVELLGNGGLYSLNYERLFPLKKNKLGLAARIGYSYWPEPQHYSKSFSYHTIPLELSALYGETHKFELGLGYTPLFMRNGTLLYDVRHIMGLRAGYRLQQPEGGFYFKCGIMMATYLGRYANEGAFSFSTPTTDMTTLMLTTGVSFGYTF